ncbi:hypothetical protein [Marinobacter sp.]|uniref:hypothetical protein n=1 Tax=Marinobacter sp. TaxID=50741 RepID=UPI00257DEF55|nr:hypothetical protein [Marinobacter sp.]
MRKVNSDLQKIYDYLGYDPKKHVRFQEFEHDDLVYTLTFIDSKEKVHRYGGITGRIGQRYSDHRKGITLTGGERFKKNIGQMHLYKVLRSVGCTKITQCSFEIHPGKTEEEVIRESCNLNINLT